MPHPGEVVFAVGQDAEFRIHARALCSVGNEPDLGLETETGRTI